MPKAYRTVIGFAERGQVMPDLHNEVAAGILHLPVEHDRVLRSVVQRGHSVYERDGEVVRGKLHGVPRDVFGQ